MRTFANSRWTLIGMIGVLLAGAFFLILNRENKKEAPFSKIEMLKDSLLVHDMFSNKSDPISRWVDLCAQKMMIRKYSTKDSLTDLEIENIKNIDQQLNQLLYERHKY